MIFVYDIVNHEIIQTVWRLKEDKTIRAQSDVSTVHGKTNGRVLWRNYTGNRTWSMFIVSWKFLTIERLPPVQFLFNFLPLFPFLSMLYQQQFVPRRYNSARLFCIEVSESDSFLVRMTVTRPAISFGKTCDWKMYQVVRECNMRLYA